MYPFVLLHSSLTQAPPQSDSPPTPPPAPSPLASRITKSLMTKLSESPTPRRDFLGQIAASAIVLAGTACAPAATAQGPAPAPAPAPAAAPPSSARDRIVPIKNWDDSWFGRLTAKHKAVFDTPDFAEGMILGPGHATRYMNGMRDALGATGADVQTVVVIRHRAIPFAFNDAMWAKYEIGKELKIKGDGGEWATRNPFAGPRGGDTARAQSSDRPQTNAVWFSSHGHVLLGCDLATQGYAGTIASQAKRPAQEIYDELRANLVPGLILQPNGIYATLRAQEAGCVFMRST